MVCLIEYQAHNGTRLVPMALPHPHSSHRHPSVTPEFIAKRTPPIHRVIILIQSAPAIAFKTIPSPPFVVGLVTPVVLGSTVWVERVVIVVIVAMSSGVASGWWSTADGSTTI